MTNHEQLTTSIEAVYELFEVTKHYDYNIRPTIIYAQSPSHVSVNTVVNSQFLTNDAPNAIEFLAYENLGRSVNLKLKSSTYCKH